MATRTYWHTKEQEILAGKVPNTATCFHCDGKPTLFFQHVQQKVAWFLCDSCDHKHGYSVNAATGTDYRKYLVSNLVKPTAIVFEGYVCRRMAK